MPFQSKNMNFVFNVEYFSELKLMDESDKAKEINEKILQQRNQELENFEFPNIGLAERYKELEGFYSHQLVTVYPGLLIGTGNDHKLNQRKLIKCGFTFDYVTGHPYLPGSSLKGILRSCFPGDKKDKEMSKEYSSMICSILRKDSDFDVEGLKRNIFEKNDVFLGAYPIIESRGGKLLQNDCITPHKEEFKNPKIINLIKVKPGIKFEFCYLLQDYVRDGATLISAEEKIELFKQLILLMGVGAKTNVGFGRFA